MPFALLCCNMSTFTLNILPYHYTFYFGFLIIGLLRLHGPGDSNSSLDASCVMMINGWICRALVLASGCLFRHIHISCLKYFLLWDFQFWIRFWRSKSRSEPLLQVYTHTMELRGEGNSFHTEGFLSASDKSGNWNYDQGQCSRWNSKSSLSC